MHCLVVRQIKLLEQATPVKTHCPVKMDFFRILGHCVPGTLYPVTSEKFFSNQTVKSYED